MKEAGGVRIRGEADGKTPIIVRPAVSVWLVVLLKLLRFFSDYRKALLVQELMVFQMVHVTTSVPDAALHWIGSLCPTATAVDNV